MSQPATVTRLVVGIRARDRRALAQAITIAESTRADHQDQAAALLDELLSDTGKAIRVGISGAPGVGKSTFVEALGLHLVDAGHMVAVLAVDPSSTRSGGSILGDKTRMSELARDPNAFIRPSPSGGTLGGVARRTREAMLLCEAFGFDVVLVETVGVGQSETVVDNMVDAFVLLVQPGGGDELQGIKRGIIELADLVVVTKADGGLAEAADRARADYEHALRFLRRKLLDWQPRVLVVSAMEGRGVLDVWTAVENHQQLLAAAGELPRMRSGQAVRWLWSELEERLLDDLRTHPAVAVALPQLEEQVASGTISPGAAAAKLLGMAR
ncbi:MAG: methylmalonyl Co-A mutase-associated GTPase MeaB [Acidimicrobiales bacterium]